jgi:hypothetical protein
MLACTSPEAIGLSVTIGYVAIAFGFATALIAAVISIRRRSFAWLPFFCLLLALHPTWMIGVMGGDCGYTRRYMSAAFSVAFIALLAIQMTRPRFSVSRFLLIACFSSLVLYLPLLALHAIDSDSWLDGRLFLYGMFAYRFSSQKLIAIAVALTSACAVSVFAGLICARAQPSNHAMERTSDRSASTF